jgi:ribosomal protein S18 acetylase RimI-like enzyme
VTYEPLFPELAFECESIAEAEARWRAELCALDQLTLVAVRADGACVGFGMLTVESGLHASVRRLHVHPDAQSSGVGHALLESLVDLSRTRGQQHIVLNVLERNRRARDFYERSGWRRAGPPAYRLLGGHEVGVVTYESTVSRFDCTVRLRGRRGEETS